jgi:hypothetical protein
VTLHPGSPYNAANLTIPTVAIGVVVVVVMVGESERMKTKPVREGLNK